MTVVDRETSAFLSRVMVLGKTTDLPVVLTPATLVRLMTVVFRDVGAILPDVARPFRTRFTYYETPIEWFSIPAACVFEDAVNLLLAGRQLIQDFDTYLLCLSELHKRRLKYSRILSGQPLPSMVQVSARALVEYGSTEPAALASWLIWRKWFFDLDNRSAQETGYLFEPILAAALGGAPRSAATKVVTRRDDPTKGRQVDCFRISASGAAMAYEFKLRVTIAASGQGRFAEELSFADDCAYSGVQPVLLVLDPTPNPRLHDLKAAFERHGGLAFIGDAAWAHLREHAGPTMSTFIDRYVATPIRAMTQYEGQLLSFSVRHSANGSIELDLGEHHRRILRQVDSSLADDAEEAS